MTEYFDPFDVFDSKIVKQNLGLTIDAIKPPKMISFKSAQDFLERSIFTKYILIPNPVGAFFSISHRLTKDSVRLCLKEQIIFLKKHPSFLEEEMRYCLIASAILLNMSGGLKHKTTEHIVWGVNILKHSILNFNFLKGVDKAGEIVDEKQKIYVWEVLRYPIALLLNHCFVSEQIPYREIENYIHELIDVGFKSVDIKSMCNYNISFFDNQSISFFIENHFEELKDHFEQYKSEMPLFKKNVKGLERHKDSITKLDEDKPG